MTHKIDFKIIIPARYQSQRLPGKPLRQILGKPMIQHVYQRAVESGASEVIIATDDQRIADAATEFNAKCIITKKSHQTGTDRLSEIVQQSTWSNDTIVVNLQGDEPHLPAPLIQLAVKNLHTHSEFDIATLATPMSSTTDVFNPNMVKVVINNLSSALYFSRAPIPWNRDNFTLTQTTNTPLDAKQPYYHHIGLYAYTSKFLRNFPSLDPCPLEQAEQLEQLRALCHGYHIHVGIIEQSPGHGVDTEEDLLRIEKLLHFNL